MTNHNLLEYKDQQVGPNIKSYNDDPYTKTKAKKSICKEYQCHVKVFMEGPLISIVYSQVFEELSELLLMKIIHQTYYQLLVVSFLSLLVGHHTIHHPVDMMKRAHYQ
jgi:hypothetical protein